LDSIFKKAVDIWASDIHIEPTEFFLLIRLRIDWDFILHDKIHKENVSSVVTRLKVLSKIKIDENKKPQDGKIVYFYEKDNQNIDIRLSTLPTKYGEKVVMRILKQDSWLVNVEALWFIDNNLVKIKETLKSTYGIVLVSGPTGSWKSTTLSWVLKNFNPLMYNISTLEDPIEYDIEYVNQSQVKPDIWYTFSAWLRSLVRQDPDIIMVWEIRDIETATLAIEAALTWHLVLSTIHTNSATWTIQRLMNMWVEPFLLVSAMKMVISQRLWKRICKNCKISYTPKEYEIKKVNEILSPIISKDELKNLNFFQGKWCEKCWDTWYKWRLWFHEVLIVWEFLEPMILNKESANSMKNEAIKNWMITITQDALLKAIMWDTTIEESLKLL
jgi:type II secretory ATPase GspE/PulE/Tfp pilus assembly ATPase PilB-like protein